ncbi:MAG: hypothetical protein CMG35_03610 [Candidatus Marinimicrobia bacterium]|jgi:hypothetical protein|nr:hypothetical protein [Candidatus Neomarinimicrobiota bacterium]|tara:strand:- start:7291 stop:7596 length:306 start_codon:yes stop_codon:yes gene_type:complete
MKIEDIPAGESWACRFKTTTFVDPKTNEAVEEKNLAIGQAHRGIPKTYESIGLIQVRDTDTRIVQLLDTVSNITFKVPFDDCWDVEVVEWINEPNETTELA